MCQIMQVNEFYNLKDCAREVKLMRGWVTVQNMSNISP